MTHPLLTWSSAPEQPGNTPAFIIEPRPDNDKERTFFEKLLRSS